MLVITCCLLRPTIIADLKGKNSRITRHLPSNLRLSRWLRIAVYGFSEHLTSHYYTPHSGRNFMPTATAVLGFSKSDRDMLGGWAAEGSERYSRAAKFKIGMMQKAVSSTFGSADHDPLAEADDLDALGVFLNSSEVSEEEVHRTKTLLASRTFTDVHRDAASDDPVDALDQESVELLQDASLDESLAMKKKSAKEKQQVWNRSRSELLGSDHKTTRATIRDQLETGYYISYSGKKAIKVLHCLGHCFMLPGVDYMSYDYVGTVIPDSSSYDTVCKWCAKKADTLRRHELIGFKHFLFD